MSPYGPSPWPNGIRFSCSIENMIRGRVKTKVLPDPVKAMPIMSLPLRLNNNNNNKLMTTLDHVAVLEAASKGYINNEGTA